MWLNVTGVRHEIWHNYGKQDCADYTIELKYQKGSEMHTSDALSQLHNFTDTPDEKDVIPLNFLQHFTPNHIEH